MLVLARKEQEIINIGDDIEITVIEIHSMNCVKLGIRAPKDVPVHRHEIYLKIQGENK
jgi:carbon storage regulator